MKWSHFKAVYVLVRMHDAARGLAAAPVTYSTLVVRFRMGEQLCKGWSHALKLEA